MSITINGRSPLSLTSVSAPTTTFSARFLTQLFSVATLPAWVPVTLYTPEHGFFTVVVRPTVGSSMSDVCLGLDWSASMRELLIGSGWTLPSGFDPIRFFLPTLTVASGAPVLPSGGNTPALASVGSSAGGAVFNTSAGGAVPSSSAGGAAVFSSAGGAVASSSAFGVDDSRAAGTASLEGFELLGSILSSSDVTGSVILNMDEQFLRRLSESHGIQCALFTSVEEYQSAVLTHLSLGFDSSRYANYGHDDFVECVRSFVARKRQELVTNFSDQHPTQFFFQNVEYMTLPMKVCGRP
ncbi:hypothetical protein R3P38DRAFT_2797781 [Favolaschia claudopus]|uniref:Uncharacterized protein n=1 Tax=Favolaschia claudopus TaxID=2862362 RepID=A0AAW0A1M3_9AGAR